MNYQEAKNWMSENKDKIVLGFCYVLVFVVGFGSGRFVKEKNPTNTQSPAYYTTKTDGKPAAAGNGEGVVAGIQAVAPPLEHGSCIIKGNISAKGKKVYHMVGGRYFKIVKPEKCFSTEAEAVAAGFAKSAQ